MIAEDIIVEDITVCAPVERARQLILLFHSFGSVPAAMVPAASRFAERYPRALIVSVAAPARFDAGFGGQWFSLQGITEANRMRRVANVMPRFIAEIGKWQRRAALDADATMLVGFSQGATMALEAVKHAPKIAARVISFGGRFADLPRASLPDTVVHLLHGKADPVVSYHHSVSAMSCLKSMGSVVTLDIQPNVGYMMDDGLVSAALDRLSLAEDLYVH